MNSVKELIKESAELIDRGWDLLGNTNMSHGPVILVYVGETAYDNREYLLKTLKNNWRNGSYIEGILVPIDYDGTNAVLLENPELDDNKGEVEGSLQSVIDQCIRGRLLQSMDGVFANKQRIFIECVMAGEDMCDEAVIEELIKPVRTLSGLELWKSLYMMIDQSVAENGENAKQMINWLNSAKERIFAADGFRQIYVLSNYLCNKTIINENRIFENYRAVSDILLLKNNYNINEGRGNNHFELLNKSNSVRTVSYKLVEKPCREIATATYMGLIAEMMNASVDEDIHKAFNTSEFTFLEDYFNQYIDAKMPGSDPLSYLAWIPEEEKRLKNTYAVTNEMLDRATQGQWSAFFELYYDDIVRNSMISDSFEAKFHHYLKGKFNYKEMRACFNSEETENVVNQGGAQMMPSPKDGLTIRAALYGKNYAKNRYYGYVAPIYKNSLDHMYTRAEKFAMMIQQINNTLPHSLMIINSNLYSSINEFYEKVVKQYISEHREDFNHLMDIDYNEKEFLNALYGFFRTMVKNLDIYKLNFEGELTERLEGFGGDYARRNKIIENALSDNIYGSRRLNLAMEANIRQIYQTYLGNPRAEFVQRLTGDKYDLEKGDYIENLVIYEINSLEDIFGGAV